MPAAPAAAVDPAVPPKVPVNRETLRQAARLFGYILPYRGKFLLAMGALLISSGLGLTFPYLIGSLFNAAVALVPSGAVATAPGAPAPGAAGQPAVGVPAVPSMLAALPRPDQRGPLGFVGRLSLNGVLALLVGQLLLQSVFSYAHVIWFNEVGERALLHIRRDTYSRLIALPMTFFAQRRVGELASRISADLTQIEDTLTGATPQFLRQATLLLGSLAFIVLTNGRLTLVMLSCFPPIVLVAILLGRKMRTTSRQAQDRLAESNTIVEETLQGIANVKAFTNEAFEIGRYSGSLHQFLDSILQGVRYRAALVAFIILAIFGAIVVVLWYGCTLLQQNQLDLGDLTRFTIYTSFIAGAVGSFADLYGQIQKTVGATARVRELLQEEPEDVVPLPPPGTALIFEGSRAAAEGSRPKVQGSSKVQDSRSKEEADEAEALGGQRRSQAELRNEGGGSTAASAPPVSRIPHPASLPRLRGDVRFEAVDFSYPSRPEVQVLHSLSLHAGPGERVALVGPSGAGKSTVVALLLRFYEPQGGRILLDGQPAAGYSLRALRGQMAVVPQEVLLFGGSIGENIAYGRPGAGQAEIEAAARQANAHEFIAGFPEGYGTLVGERGIKLSGGQRQRVAIARAILKDPAILILDEATSALDSESERQVQDALDVLMRGRTSFIIAHRLATVREADRIVVIRAGTVAESGTHAELLADKDGLYRRLSEFQFDLRDGSPT